MAKVFRTYSDFGSSFGRGNVNVNCGAISDAVLSAAVNILCNITPTK